MPDISMCASVECPSRKSCYRHAESGTKPTEWRQSYMAFKPRKGDGKCLAYMPVYRDRARAAASESEAERLREESADKDDEIAMLRDSEARWIARLAVVREATGDNGKMMLPEFKKWFDERWASLLAAEAEAAALRERVGAKERAIKTLIAYCEGGIADGYPYSPTLPSAIAAARTALEGGK